MPIDRYTKIVLTLIAVLLAVIAVKPFVEPAPSQAAKSIGYKAVDIGGWSLESVERDLNQFGRQGWDLVTVSGKGAFFKR